MGVFEEGRHSCLPDATSLSETPPLADSPDGQSAAAAEFDNGRPIGEIAERIAGGERRPY